MTVINEDILKIIEDFDMSVFDKKTVMITGATGLIGKLCVKSLLSSKYNTKVIALVRNKNKALDIFAENHKLEFIIQDINSEIDYNKKVDYIIHCASPTSSKDFVQKPIETIGSIINGTKNVLELAKKNKVVSVVFLSSLEVYGQTDIENVSENNFGYIDILNPRSCYSEGKRMAETLCVSYGSEFGVPVKIARLSQTFGADVSKEDNRVFAQFAKAVINKENIILHTKGETKRNYCDTTDAVRAIFTILTKGQNNQAYNIANKNTYVSIYELAKMFENDCTKVEIREDNLNRGYNPTVKIALNTQKLEALGWEAKINLQEMITKLIKSIDN